MASNLPPGCSESDIPGNRAIDKEVDRLIDEEDCSACKHFHDEDDDYFHCLNSNECAGFEVVDDLAEVAERMKASAEAREDGHCDG